jgi:hypothetical protein
MPYNGSLLLKKEIEIPMQEFVRIRVAIDSLIDDTKLSIQNKSVSESMQQLEQARGLIQQLKLRSTSDQAGIVARRETTIESLSINAGKIKIGKTGSKKTSTKETLAQPSTF